MLFSRLSILSGDGCDWWLHVKVVCGRYASFCGNMGFGGGEGGNIAWIFPEQSLNLFNYSSIKKVLLVVDQFQNLEGIAGRILGYFSQSPTFFVREIFDGIVAQPGGAYEHM